MQFNSIFVDCAYILFVVIGACVITGLQCGITGSYVQRLGNKVGPDYWGSVYGRPDEQSCERSIALHKPAREMQSNYGRKS